MTTTKPILRIGHYQLIYRNNADNIAQEQHESAMPFRFVLLRDFVGTGVVISFFSLILDWFLDTPISLFSAIAVMSAFSILPIRSIVYTFHLTDTRNPTKPLNLPNPQNISPLHWGFLIGLASLYALEMYLRHNLHLPIRSMPLTILNLMVFCLGFPYFIASIYKILTR